MLNLGEFPSVLVRFEARFNAILFSACGDSYCDVTLYYIVFSGFYSFLIPFFRKYILTILLSVYLLFSHIFMFNHFFLRSFFFWPVMTLRILNTLDSTIKKKVAAAKLIWRSISLARSFRAQRVTKMSCFIRYLISYRDTLLSLLYSMWSVARNSLNSFKSYAIVTTPLISNHALPKFTSSKIPISKIPNLNHLHQYSMHWS